MQLEFFTKSADESQDLHYVIWEPATEPIAVLQIVHGMEEYILRYQPFAEALIARGWAVIGHDHLGHGQSGKYERGFFTESTDGANILIEDMHSITSIAHNRWPEAPVCLFGHSMGSFFTRRYLTEYAKDLTAVVICGSGWYSSIATGTAYYAARLIGAIKGEHTKSRLLTIICSLPFLTAFKEEGRGAWLSKNRANVARYKADPLCGFGFTCGGYRYMYENLLRVSQHYHFDRLSPLPMLVISGADDPVGGASGVKQIAADYRRLGFTDVTEYAIPDNRHEILFEDEAPATIRYIADWLNAHLRA